MLVLNQSDYLRTAMQIPWKAWDADTIFSALSFLEKNWVTPLDFNEWKYSANEQDALCAMMDLSNEALKNRKVHSVGSLSYRLTSHKL